MTKYGFSHAMQNLLRPDGGRCRRRFKPVRLVGCDARDLESIIDDVYIKNYKFAGQPFWSPVAAVEQATGDLLGRVAKKPVHESTTAEEQVDVYARGLAATGAKPVKLKIGGRMSRNADTYSGPDQHDAGNGGRHLVEPCPWEEVGETKRVSDALEMRIAGGECDSSLWKFQAMIERRVIARMAAKAGMKIVPYNTQIDAAAIPNIGAYMEFQHRGQPQAESWFTPNFRIENGLGLDFDPDYLKLARRVESE